MYLLMVITVILFVWMFQPVTTALSCIAVYIRAGGTIKGVGMWVWESM